MANKVTTRIEHPETSDRQQDWEELTVHFGDDGEPIKYERRVFDPDYPGGCVSDVTAAKYRRYWAFVQKKFHDTKGMKSRLLK